MSVVKLSVSHNTYRNISEHAQEKYLINVRILFEGSQKDNPRKNVQM